MDCPLCGSPMRARNGRYGPFYGCTRYPACCGTRPMGGSLRGRRASPSPRRSTIPPSSSPAPPSIPQRSPISSPTPRTQPRATTNRGWPWLLAIGAALLLGWVALTSLSHPGAGTPGGVRIGAICRDGWHSSATGSGACSHHGGVDHWLYSQAEPSAAATPAGLRIGAICRDGWHSSATGSGACSQHGGVDHWLYAEAGPSEAGAQAGPSGGGAPAPVSTPAGVRVGAVCRDGWRSSATGSGACSHHGGVAYWPTR